MYRLPSEEKQHKETIGALILSIIIIIAGIGGMIYTKHESLEYKNSTDVRTLHATVYSCEQSKEKERFCEVFGNFACCRYSFQTGRLCC